MSISDVEAARKTSEYENPTFGYRKGADGEIEKDIFDGVLPKGWVDSPAKVGKRKKAEAAKEATEDDASESTPDPAEGLEPPYDQYTFHQLRAELKRRTGMGPKIGTTTAGVIAALVAWDPQPTDPA